MADRGRHVVHSCVDGGRIVIFSGGEAKDDKTIPSEVRGIGQGGGFGSIRCRNSVQRPNEQAIRLLDQIMDIHAGGKMLAGVS